MRKTSLRIALALVGVIASAAAGPALSAQINKCTKITKPGFYVLTRNLTAHGDCLVVTADFVTIDLGGWVITGDGTGFGVRADGASRLGIKVRNGTITCFLVGVGLGQGAVVEKVRVARVEETGISAGDESIVSGNTVSVRSRPIFGISAGAHSIVSGNIASSNSTTIAAGEGSIVSDNVVASGDDGLAAGPLSTVSGNTVAGNESGIGAGRGSTVNGNTAEALVAIGVTCPSNVIGNTASGPLSLVGEGCTNIDNLVILP